MAMIKCPKCGEEISGKANFCPNCGWQVVIQAKPEEWIVTDTDEDGYDDYTDDDEYEDEEIPNGSSYDEKFVPPEPVWDKSKQKSRSDPKQNRRSERGLSAKAPARSSSSHKKKKKRKKKNKLIPVLIAAAGLCVAAVIGIGLFTILSQPNVKSIKVTYNGSTEAGIVLDGSNKGIHVIGTLENGETKELTSGWSIKEPKELEADRSEKVTVTYKDLEKDFSVKCSTSEVINLEVTYDGDTEEGIVIDEDNPGIKVVARYRNGKKETIDDGWTIVDPITLEKDSTSHLLVEYKGKQGNCEVVCSTTTLIGISAEYNSILTSGMTLRDSNDYIVVTAQYGNGTTEEVSGWHIDEEKTILPGRISTVTIYYEDKSCELSVRGEPCFDSQAGTIDGDHFTFTDKEFMDYAEDHTGNTYFVKNTTHSLGEDFYTYGLKSADGDAVVVGLKQNENGDIICITLIGESYVPTIAYGFHFMSFIDKDINTDSNSPAALAIGSGEVYTKDNLLVQFGPYEDGLYMFIIMPTEAYSQMFSS